MDKIYQYSATSKKRNTYILVPNKYIIVIDPQKEAIQWIFDNIRLIDDIKEINVVLSHEHTNHFDGLKEFIDRLIREFVFPVTIIMPEGVIHGIVSHALDHISVITVKEQDTVNGVFYKRVYGHCGKMITATIKIDGKTFMFLSDNLTTCFPTPITNEGGSWEKMLTFLRSLVNTDNETTVYLPGHGVIKDKKHIVEYYNYFCIVAGLNWNQVPDILIDNQYKEIGKIFHKMNKRQAMKFVVTEKNYEKI